MNISLKIMNQFKNLQARNIFIIEKFIKPEILLIPEKTFWGNQIGILNKILKKYPAELLLNIELGFKLNSLSWFLTFDGIKRLNLEKNKNIDIINKKKYNIGNEKIGNDISVKDRKPTILEFLE
mgnify:CR=1 FL=1